MFTVWGAVDCFFTLLLTDILLNLYIIIDFFASLWYNMLIKCLLRIQDYCIMFAKAVSYAWNGLDFGSPYRSRNT